MKKDILTRPFAPEQVKQRQGQHGKTLSYVETSAVIARLNEGCDRWDFQVERYEILDEEVVVLGRLIVEGTVIKAAFGGAAITRDHDRRVVSIGDDLKAAASDALKKSASLLGVGLELYGGATSAKTSVSASTPQRAAAANDNTPISSPPDRATQRQVSAVQDVTRRQNIARDRLAAMLTERFGKRDLHALTKREASSLLSELTGSNGHTH